MYSINAPYSLEKIDSSDKGKKYLLIVYDRPYSIGELVYLIINYLAEGKSNEEISGLLNVWAGGQYQFTLDKVKNIIEYSIRPLGIFDAESKSKGPSRLSTIQGQWTLAKFEHIKWLIGILKYAFYPAVFTLVFLVAAAINSYYMYPILTQKSALSASLAYQAGGECLRTFGYVALFYPLILIVLFFHELGHAASAYMFGVKPKNIGFGFYLMFPVLYADITETWKLNKWQKTIVNLGGIYFQLLINLGLLYWMYHTHNRQTGEILGYVIGLNIATVLINVNPFFKFDGYWVYSDLFSLPNLSQQAGAYGLTVLKSIFPKIPIQVSKNIKQILNMTNPFLIVYTICKYIFMVYIIGLLAMMVANQAKNVAAFFTLLASVDFSICAVEFYLKTLLLTGAIVYFASRYKKAYNPIIKNALNRSRS